MCLTHSCTCDPYLNLTTLPLFTVLLAPGPFSAVIVIASVQPVIVAIGLDICKETIGMTPRRHYPAFLLGLMPSMADWALGLSKAADITSDTTRAGLTNLSHGAILVSILLTSVLIYLIDRDYRRLSIWCAIGSVASFFGLIHSSAVGWLVGRHDVAWKFAMAYGVMAACAYGAHVAQARRRIEGVREEAKEEEKEAEIEEEEKKGGGQENACCYCV